MSEQKIPQVDRRASAAEPAPRPWVRREPGLAVLTLGLAVMILALVLPHEHRTFAFYPALLCVGIGVIMTLHHGPEPLKKG
jgi:hypothetical protein